MDLDAALLWSHAAATTGLAGLIWVVQMVVYPSFRVAGQTPDWPRLHAHHTRAMGRLVVLPWAVQGLTLLGLLLRRPDGLPLILLGVTAALAATTVAVTAGSSVPVHTRLAERYDEVLVGQLIRTNWWRTTAWTAGAVCSLVLLGLGTA